MRGKLNDLTNKRFGQLLALDYKILRKGVHQTAAIWRCICKCGEETFVESSNLLKKIRPIKSCKYCGYKASANLNRTHGHTVKNSPTYRTWSNMRTRCTNPNRITSKYYLNRNIKICKRWERFENFLEDMGIRPESTSLDRINTNGNYSPSNCRWATIKEQARNTRKNKYFYLNDCQQTIGEISDATGIRYRNLWHRINKLHLSAEEAIEYVDPRRR